jgi:hypothetical protein
MTNYNEVTPALLNQVRAVVKDAERHEYSVSKIYNAHNAVFKLNEPHESCSSCLRNRSAKLKEWLREYDTKLSQKKKIEASTNQEGNEPKKTDKIAAIQIETKDGLLFNFTPNKEGSNRGKVVLSSGLPVKAGTYLLTDDREIAVQPAGKATIKESA